MVDLTDEKCPICGMTEKQRGKPMVYTMKMELHCLECYKKYDLLSDSVIYLLEKVNTKELEIVQKDGTVLD